MTTRKKPTKASSGIRKRKKFSFEAVFQRHFKTIQKELMHLDPKVLKIHRNQPHEVYMDTLLKKNGWTPSWQVKSPEPNYAWMTYVLCFDSRFPPEATKKFPKTMAILKKIKGIKICGVSCMKPHSYILPHRHPELGGNLLTYHLGLSVPAYCYLNVEGEFLQEKTKKAIIFDGSKDHFAINMSAHDRLILYMEFDKSKL